MHGASGGAPGEQETLDRGSMRSRAGEAGESHCNGCSSALRGLLEKREAKRADREKQASPRLPVCAILGVSLHMRIICLPRCLPDAPSHKMTPVWGGGVKGHMNSQRLALRSGCEDV